MRLKKIIISQVVFISACFAMVEVGEYIEPDTPERVEMQYATYVPDTPSPTLKSTYKEGDLTDTYFKSKFIGVEFKTNWKYTLATREQMKEQSKQSIQFLFGEAAGYWSEYASSTTVDEIMATSVFGGSYLCIQVGPMDVPGTTEKQLSDAMIKQTQKAEGVQIKIVDRKQENFCGQYYFMTSCDVVVRGEEEKLRLYILKKEDRFIIMTVVGEKDGEKDMDELVGNFKPLKE